MNVDRASRLGMLLLLAPLGARGEPASRFSPPAVNYNDPPPLLRRSPLAARLEDLAQRAARRLGREAPEVDPRLEMACAALLPFLPDNAPPDNELVDAALRLQGIVEPSPHLVAVGTNEAGVDALLEELPERLVPVLKQGRYRRMGIAVGPSPNAPDRTAVLIAFQESFLDLQPVPRELPAGARVTLDGRVGAPYQHTALLVTSPDGAVARVPVSPVVGDARGEGRFRAVFSCGPAPGRYQIEITGDDRYGPAVLGNFPLYCGTPAPRALHAATLAPARPWTDAADAEAQVLDLLNEDRAHAGVRAVLLDERLSAVARAHSADMRDRRFVGHVSPRTGSADDRLKRVGVVAPLVLENVCRAYSPREAERGLMDSPGHRANIVSSAVERVGIGVAVGSGQNGERELLLTQLFVHLPAVYDAQRTPAELRTRLGQLRREAGAPALEPDPALDAVALEIAAGIAEGKLAAEHPGAPVERALPQLSERYRTLRTAVVTDAGEPAQLNATPALIDRAVTHAGVAVRPGPRPPSGDSQRVIMVVLLGSTRDARTPGAKASAKPARRDPR